MKNEFNQIQHYAVSHDGILVHINEAHNNSEDYFCPHCGCRMLKRCGNIRAWHFAHDWRHANDSQKKCSYETYLHGYAKFRLQQWFYESERIMLHYVRSTVCEKYATCNFEKSESCSRGNDKTCDLKQIFNNCTIESSVEESNGNYRADLLLTTDRDSERRILIEIKVSHGCSEKKKASNARIIEFDVNSEEDVEYIISHDIKESDKVRYYGFKNLIKRDRTGSIAPAYKLQKFILYKSGKPICLPTDCQSMTDHKPSSIFEITTNLDEDIGELYMYGLMKALEQGLNFPNCFLCKHKCFNLDTNCSICEINESFIETAHNALSCPSYIFKPTVFKNIKLSNLEVLHIWRQQEQQCQ